MAKRSGAFHQLFYHFVWSTRDRLPLITRAVEERLYPYLAEKCAELGYRLLAANGTEDHVHVLVELAPTMVVADVVKHLKGASSHYINRESGLDETLYWQDGYGVVTLRQGDADGVAAYIGHQKQHHTGGRLSELLERSAVG